MTERVLLADAPVQSLDAYVAAEGGQGLRKALAHTDIVIIGGGFGAMNAAVALDRRLKRGLKIEVTLISRSNFFLFTHLLAEVAASLVEARHAVSPIRRMLDRVRFIEGTVQTVDPVRRTVAFVDQNGHSRLLSYQHCLLASGSVTEFFGIPGLAENALTLKTLGDAIGIRNRIIDLLERSALLSKAERSSLLTFIVVGGGLNGTEIAGELHDFVLEALEDYPAIDPGEIRMVLIEMLDRLAQELPPELSAYAQRNLESRGIEVWLVPWFRTQAEAISHPRPSMPCARAGRWPAISWWRSPVESWSPTITAASGCSRLWGATGEWAESSASG